MHTYSPKLHSLPLINISDEAINNLEGVGEEVLAQSLLSSGDSKWRRAMAATELHRRTEAHRHSGVRGADAGTAARRSGRRRACA